ncbi:hypothetical protein [Catenulispora rubra]|uniref:hypothetical protein n=1 Tax=Catenulispora rubra TaxID=280293 RepID=UPI0018927C78|nr:hypothetical protein [Catenulispora rubra]
MNRPVIALFAATTLTAALVSAWSGTAQATTHAGPAAIVAMGDSAISGEGAGTDTGDDYVAGTDGPGDYCHRSTKSEIFDTGLSGLTPFDVACSGAQTGDVASLPQYSAVTGSGGGDYGEPKQDTQLAAIAKTDSVKMVVLTIGANDDFDFTGIVGRRW